MKGTHRIASTFVALALLALLPGCVADTLQAGEPRFQGVQSREFDLPPQQVFEIAKQAVSSEPLNLGVEQAQNGVIVTGFEEHPGRFQIARRWQERTRYRIAVIPDFNQPTQRARVEVTEETQERRASNQEYTPVPELTRTERAEAVLEQLTTAIQSRTRR